MTRSSSTLRRYTDLASLLDLLQRRSITLLPPGTWDDRNDRLMMETYRTSAKLETLLALCLTSRGETYHHWKVFTEKDGGVCIHFQRAGFSELMSAANVRVRSMKYLRLDQLDANKLPAKDLPFLKRLAFKDEGEVRAVYENKARETDLKRINIDFGIIDRITLNPWMPKSVADSVRTTVESLTKGANFEVVHSSLIDARGWRRFAQEYVKTGLA
jgi:hypothetical protein